MNYPVSFSRIKQQVTMRPVLEHFRWTPSSRRGDRAHGPCPIHGGHRNDAFHVDLARNVFHCFTCQAHGDVIDLTAAMERCSPAEAALRLQRWFEVEPATPEPLFPPQSHPADGANQPVRKKTIPALGFLLRPIDSAHPSIRDRGIGPVTAMQFGTGYYSGPGLMRNRVVIPIHDEAGHLVAYAGRATEPNRPRYLLPPGFPKSSVVFNLHRAIATGKQRVIVVEGFFGCMRVHQAGYPCVTALMGCKLSSIQRQLLSSHFSSVSLMLDPDDAGRHATGLIARQLAPLCRVDIVHPPDHPDQMSLMQLRSIIAAM